MQEKKSFFFCNNRRERERKMNLVNWINKEAIIPLISLDKLIVGNLKDTREPVVTWLLLNHQHGNSITFEENLDQKIPLCSLYTGEISLVIPPTQEGIITCKTKNYVDISNLVRDFGAVQVKESLDDSVEGLWKWAKNKLYTDDLFTPVRDDAPEIEFATDPVTRRLVLVEYGHRLMGYTDENGDIKILGLILFEKVADHEVVLNKAEKNMAEHLRKHLLEGLVKLHKS
jgi:hypothetical protein